jgi:AraC-like DNA-binding protein
VGLPDQRRIELWERHNAAALIGLTCHTTGRSPLEATELNVELEQVHLARVAGSAHTVQRNTSVIRESPADAIAVYLTLRGDAWFEHSGGTRALRPGNIVLCDADRPFARGFTRGLEELAIKVPRSALGDHMPPASLRTPVIADFARGRDPYARALARLADRTARADPGGPASERTVVELVAVLGGGRQANPSLAHRAAGRCFIEEHLHEPGLTATQVAAAIGVSERHLSRVFAADGTSIPRYVLSRRLQLAHAILSDPAGRATVADVAAQCGFASATYFSHVFRERFGQRAGEVRRQARVPQAAPA